MTELAKQGNRQGQAAKPAVLKAILFDLDDTLITWEPFEGEWQDMDRPHLQGVFDYISAEIQPLSDIEQYAESFYDITVAAWESARTTEVAPNLLNALVDAAVKMGAPRDKIDLEKVMEVYKWGAVPGTEPFPDTVEALELFIEADIKIGIVTNAYQPMKMRDVEIDEHGILQYFPDCRISAADVGWLKPNKIIFEKALDCIGTRPEETVFVGDNLRADIIGAQRLGMKAIWRRTYDMTDVPDVLKDVVAPDAMIDSLLDIPPYLDEWYPGWR